MSDITTTKQQRQLLEGTLYAQIHGNNPAVLKFSKSLCFCASEAAVRNFKREILKQLKEGVDLITIPTKKKG